jgi:hypothetical protein
MVLFGESHLAPGHLPLILRDRLPGQRLLTVLQNVDALYWRAAGESCPHVDAVRVSEDVICVFNSTPLEKYESYRLCLDRWSQTESDAPDLTPAVYNLIDGLVRFLNINCYSPHNGSQPKLLVDLLPEVYSDPPDTALNKLLSAVDDSNVRVALRKCLEERGSVYIAKTNTLLIRDFQLQYIAKEVARFLYHACMGLPENRSPDQAHGLGPEDTVYAKTLETALVTLAGRVLCPFRAEPAQAESGGDSLGVALGDGLYRAYVQGNISRTVLRRLFLTRLQEPGAARKTYREAAHKTGIPVRITPVLDSAGRLSKGRRKLSRPAV